MKLPKPSERLKRLVACGTLQTDDPAILEQIARIGKESTEDGYIASDGTGGYIKFLAGSIPADKNSKHIHIEVVSCDCSQEPQKPNCPLEKIQMMIDQFNGLMVEADFSAVFWIPIRSLPAFGLILGCKVESEFESMKIRQSTAIFTVERGPVDQIYWTRLPKQPDLINIALSVSKITSFDRDYLTSIELLMNRTFDFLVLEEHLNAERA